MVVNDERHVYVEQVWRHASFCELDDFVRKVAGPLSASTGGAFHIWRQRFPDGVPEQVTSGLAEEEGIAMMPDGRSFITAVGQTQSSVWLAIRRNVVGSSSPRRQQAFCAWTSFRRPPLVASPSAFGAHPSGWIPIVVDQTTVRGMPVLMAGVRYKVAQTRKLEHLYREALSAWQQSKAQRTRRRQRKSDGQTGAGGAVAEVIVDDSYGDPRYLEAARRALADLARISGTAHRAQAPELEAPTMFTLMLGDERTAPRHATTRAQTREGPDEEQTDPSTERLGDTRP